MMIDVYTGRYIAKRHDTTPDKPTSSMFIRGLFVLLVLVISLYSNDSAASEKKPVSSVPEEYVIGAGDVLDVLIYEEPKLSRNVLVRIDGRISLPLVGEFMAAGQTPASLSKKISQRLVEYVADTSVAVILQESNSKVYYILGQIATPGEFTITQPITVLQAIARAGGLLEWAKRSEIMIVSRPGLPEKITYFDYDRFLKGGGKKGNVVINPGDTIVIP